MKSELTEKHLEEIRDYIAGSCQMGGIVPVIELITGEAPSDLDEDAVMIYLETEGMFECESCGWWNHPGEGSPPICDECLGDEHEDDE